MAYPFSSAWQKVATTAQGYCSFANLHNFANLWSARQRAMITYQRRCSFFANLHNFTNLLPSRIANLYSAQVGAK